jgi:diguanylate cyclase (GGDEF)-like protein
MRILVADDDATSRILVKTMVSKLGHECLVADEGSSAWELLRSRPIDVLLSDWMMPGVDGPELCRRVRNEDEADDHYVYIVLTTGLDHPEQVLEGMNAGADDYLIKPVDFFGLQTTLVAAERVTGLHAKLARKEAELERLNIELLERSLTDELTGLGNRRRMEQDVEHTHARALRSGRAYGVALFDIDYFKLYNDRCGHIAGDQILRSVAETMDRGSRAGECVYRYGGEEFLLLVPDCRPIDAIYVTAERIRRAVADLAVPHESRPTEPFVVTVSSGVACWTQDAMLSAREVIAQADEALFAAKTAGRNRIDVGPSLVDQLHMVSTADV